MPSPNAQPRLYFAYGSNLSLTQMARRCPTATYHSLAVLRGWKWVIGPRGYANVVESKSRGEKSLGGREGNGEEGREEEMGDEVYGLLYVLEEEDEENLDRAEGVPVCYRKMGLCVEILSGEVKGEVEVLVYVDIERTGEGICQEEYVARMNRGIKDAVEKGMPQSYVDRVLRKWVRDEDLPTGEVKDPFLGGGE